MASTATTPATPAERAEEPSEQSPPAKRRRENRERSRVTRACDRCKSKKARCTGTSPCAICVRNNVPCTYAAPYNRGKLPPIPVQENVLNSYSPGTSISRTAQSSTDTASPNVPTTPVFNNAAHVPSPSAANQPLTGDGYARMQVTHLLSAQPPTLTDDTARDPLSRSSPEPTQTDRQGHYIGPSSGVSFLLRIQKKLHENSSSSPHSSIFTFGDAPLPEFDPTFFVLPPKDEAQRLVERYFDFAAPTHRFLHRPSIERLLEEFYERRGELVGEDGVSRTALLLIVFAQGLAYMPPGTTGEDNSARYYFAAEHQLGKEKGAVRLASVQARLVQCYYLLAQSRINQCWSLFGTTAHLALAIGLNRGRPADAGGKIDYIELECRRRTFWSAYVLDKFIAAALGRPRTFRDEDIDQDLPTITNDTSILPNTILPSPSSPQSIMLAPVEHIKLSQIISSVLSTLYGIRPPSPTLRLQLATKYTDELRTWRARIARFLDAEGVDSSLLIPLYQRQRNVLNLSYWHTMLLVHRPFLLGNFAGLGLGGCKSGSPTNANTNTNNIKPERQNITLCLSAALEIVRIVDDIFQSSQIFRAFWFTQYYAFCAVVVLYIYRIQQHLFEGEGVDETDGNEEAEGGTEAEGKCTTVPEGYFAAGVRCQMQLSSLSEGDCLSKRYVLVLEELRIEAVRRMGKAGEGGLTGMRSTGVGDAAANGAVERLGTGLQSNAAVQSGETDTVGIDATPTANTAAENAFASAATFYGPAIPPTPESAVFSNTWLGNNSFMEDLTSWGQFDSLVTAGIGVFEGGGGFQGENGFGGFGVGR